MPFAKKEVEKKHKTAADYEQKNIYFDAQDKYQNDAYKMFTLCGHKQSKFVGLLVHEFLLKYGINPNNMTRSQFADCLKIYEMQVTTGATFTPQISSVSSSLSTSVENTSKDSVKINNDDEEFIKEDDMDDMNNALAAFGSL